MAKVEMYSTLVCPYCNMAKQLLQSKGVDFIEYRIDEHPEKMNEMLERCEGRRSVPQILINDVAVGGYDDLRALEVDGSLDNMLAAGENDG